jgi:hypothetical protein
MHSALLTNKLTTWQAQAALLWSQHSAAHLERARILNLYSSYCCDGERSCRCDFRDFATTAEKEQVQELDYICDDSYAEYYVLKMRIDRAQRVQRYMAIPAMRFPDSVAMKVMVAA